MNNIDGSTDLTLVLIGHHTDIPEHSVIVKEHVITQDSIAKDFHFQEIQAIQMEEETDANVEWITFNRDKLLIFFSNYLILKIIENYYL